MSILVNEQYLKEQDLNVIASYVDSPMNTEKKERIIFKKAEGALIYDQNDNNYIDMVNGKGSIILGHNDQDVIENIKFFLNNNLNIFTGPSQHIVELANMVIEDLGISEGKASFYTTGTAACRSAAITAKNYTGHEIILSAGYHGWDAMWSFSGKLFEPNKDGVIDFYFIPEVLESLVNKYKGRVAMVMISPDYTYNTPETLNKIIEITRSHNILFCCDDVKQGYRHRQGSSLELVTGEKADLYTFSKGLANGYRLSCLAGKAEVMDESRELTYTSYYDVLPVAASLATLKKMRQNHGYTQLNEIGKKLVTGLNRLFKDYQLPIIVKGSGPIFQFVVGDKLLEDEFYKNAISSGLVLFEGDNQTISFCYNDAVITEVLKRFDNLLSKLNKEFQHLKGMEITDERIFRTAWNMIDGAPDLLSLENKIKLIEELVFE